jgi:UDP-GlcNAc:undecaprenyl-phosphate GlcNAc-1-phosphate transferase
MLDSVVAICLLISVCLVAALFAAVGTWAIRQVALVRRWTFTPNSHRHIHNGPIPRLGGVAIFCAFTALGTLLSLLQFTWLPIDTERFVGFAIASLVVFVIGVYDDLIGLGAREKLLAQAIGGVVLYVQGYKLELFTNSGLTGEIVAFVLTITWVAAISNAFNLVDGLDGLAGGTAFFSTIAIVAIAFVIGDTTVLVLAAVLAGCLVGFLFFNRHPATIFMGDCGSLLIGCMLAGFSLALTRSLEPGFSRLAIPVMCCAFPIFETALSIVRRLATGRPPFCADREHIHHRLLDVGLSQKQAVSILYLFSALCAVAAFALTFNSFALRLLAIGLPFGVFWTACIILGYGSVFGFSVVPIPHGNTLGTLQGLNRVAEKLRRAGSGQQIYYELKSAFEKSDFDGFELFIANDDESTGHFYSWTRFPRKDGKMPNYWNLSLNLGTHSAPDIGYFVIYREYQRGVIEEDLDRMVQVIKESLSQNLERLNRRESALRHSPSLVSAAVRLVERNID